MIYRIIRIYPANLDNPEILSITIFAHQSKTTPDNPHIIARCDQRARSDAELHARASPRSGMVSNWVVREI